MESDRDGYEGGAAPYVSPQTEALAQAFRLGVESASSGDEATTSIADSAHGMGQECAVNDCIRILESNNCTSDRAAAATLREHFKFLKLDPPGPSSGAGSTSDITKEILDCDTRNTPVPAHAGPDCGIEQFLKSTSAAPGKESKR